MTSQQLDEERIFLIARKQPDRETQSEYLDQVCAGDQALRERVEELLRVHEQEQSFLKSSGDPPPTEAMGALNISSGQQIGRYKLLQKIGEGGFGVVFMAEQSRPVRRKVALKVIKPGMDTQAIVARFEAERQALAMMEHPNIARVFDGGATDGGRPYFVMELVKGVPITEYCDKNELSTEQRLTLFTTVCQAVQHAHQKGIIHRDLKPSNVLVTLADGEPVVKVIDFGVAKATNQQLTEKTLFTAFGQMVGTPQYMSPEQAEMSCLDVDTRSDVYSLGVLLYELLTGTTPLEADRLRTAGYAEMQRLIREEEPPKPSTRLSTSGDKLTILARHRKVTPEKLKSQVKGDLDWIVMKALEKDRNRRYESPASLGDDVGRMLSDEPVEACPPSRSYRLKKFIRRNRLLVSTSSVVIVALVFGLGLAIWGMKQANDALIKYSISLEDSIRDKLAVGDVKSARTLLQAAQVAGLDQLSLGLLWGELHIIDGEFDEAVKLLEPLKQEFPSSMALQGILAMANHRLGFEQKLIEGMTELKDRRPTEFTDLLYRGWMYSNYAPGEGLVDISAARRLKPASLIALLREAEAMYHQAELSPDPQESLDYALAAIERLKALQLLVPNHDLVEKELALSYITASVAHRELGDAELSREAMLAAREAALGLKDLGAFEVLYVRAMYYLLANDIPALLSEYESVKDFNRLDNYYLACVAIAYFGQGDDRKALDVLEKAEPDFREGVARRVVAYASIGVKELDVVQEEFWRVHRNDDLDVSIYESAFDWTIFRLFHDTNGIARTEAQLLQVDELPWWEGLFDSMWWEEFGKFLQSDRDADDLSLLLDKTSNLRINRVGVRFCLAMDRLADGEIDAVEEHLDAGIRTGCIRGFAYWLCLAFKNRLEIEPDWPANLDSSNE